MTILEKIDSYIARGYEVTIEGGGYQFDASDKEDRPYWVNLFLGDSNGPHKPGTLVGVGRGWTMEEAFDDEEDGTSCVVIPHNRHDIRFPIVVDRKYLKSVIYKGEVLTDRQHGLGLKWCGYPNACPLSCNAFHSFPNSRKDMISRFRRTNALDSDFTFFGAQGLSERWDIVVLSLYPTCSHVSL